MSQANDPKKEKKDVDPSALLDDIFAEEQAGDNASKAFADLEQLNLGEVAAETEAVVQELRIRQGE
jgi:hypothetical protein